MVLSDKDIKKYISSGKVKVTPRPDYASQLGSCSLDLRLGDVFRVYDNSSVAVIDPYDRKIMEKLTNEVKVDSGEAFILHPGEFALAVTEEYIELPDDLTARLEGRSSIGRLGVIIHSTAANIDSGFRGQITLELANMGRLPVKLYPGMSICSLSFETLSSPSDVPYYKKKTAKYLNQKSPLPSRLSREKSTP
ncbi:dCTP deaminase [Candidatus Microgenomates bacterium]|nr:dCTP deaminase [Candidatus Microgenomates bacterium]